MVSVGEEATNMPSITIKSIPAPLYESLKRSASLHRRSLNSEALTCLEMALMPHPVDPEEFLRDLDALHASRRIPRLTDAVLRRARREGRP
jgi:hypothetical protein